MNKYDLTISENDGIKGIEAIKFNKYDLLIQSFSALTLYKTHSNTYLPPPPVRKMTSSSFLSCGTLKLKYGYLVYTHESNGHNISIKYNIKHGSITKVMYH